MSSLALKKMARQKRQSRVRKKIRGTSERPRLNVFKSSRHITLNYRDIPALLSFLTLIIEMLQLNTHK